jgi:hypothetical protein
LSTLFAASFEGTEQIKAGYRIIKDIEKLDLELVLDAVLDKSSPESRPT